MPGTAWYRKDRLYREAEELARWVRWAGHGVVKGMPGTGKTTRILLLPLFLDFPVVVSFPLRKIRDEFYNRLFTDARLSRLLPITYIVRAHDEVCPSLAQRIQQRPGDRYFVVLAEHLKASAKGVEQCFWKSEVRRAVDLLKSNRAVLILTTHQVAFMLRLLSWVYGSNAYFFFDEGEDLFLRLGEPVNLEEIEVLKYINRKLYRRLKGIFQSPHPVVKVGYVLQPLVRDLLRESFFVSASFPPTLLSVLEQTEEDYPVYTLRMRRERDTLVILDKDLWWVQRSKWEKVIYPQTLQVIAKAREKGFAVGVVARNLEQCNVLTKLCEDLGYTVWSDCRDGNPRQYWESDVVVITVMGKGYRGVNLYTRKNRDRQRWDFGVVVGFFQARGLDRSHIHPVLYGMMMDNPFKKEEGEDEIGDFIEEMTYAKNFQALFRFIRDPARKHVLVLMDKRWEKALSTYAWSYYYESPKVKVRDEQDLASKVATALDSIM